MIDTGWIERPFALPLVWMVGLLGVGTAMWCGAASALMLATRERPDLPVSARDPSEQDLLLLGRR